MTKTLLAAACGLLCLPLLIGIGPSAAQDTKSKSDQTSKKTGEKPTVKPAVKPAKNTPATKTPEKDLPVRVGVDETAAIRKALQKKVTLKFKSTPLTKVIDRLAEETKLQLVINEPALEEDGISLDEAIDFVSKEVTVEHALDRILEPIGCTWHIENEVVQITTQIAVGDPRHMLVRMYRAPTDLEALQSPTTDGLIQRQPMTPWKVSEGDMIIDLIMTSTSGPWFDIDQEGGTISRVGDLLIVRQSFGVHEEVETLLAALTVVGKKQAHATAIPVRGTTDDGSAERNTEAILSRKVTFEYDNVSLRAMMIDLSKQTGLEFILDIPALEEDGISTDELVTIKLKDVTLRAALDIALAPHGMTIVFRNGVIKVTTEIAAGDLLTNTVYVVDDILAAGQVDSDSLIDMLMTQTSGPWFDIDAEGGTIGMWLRPTLVVRQTRKVHAEIAAILIELRQGLAKRKPDGKKQAKDTDEVVLVTYDWTNIADDGEQLLTAIKTMVAPKTWTDSDNGGVVLVVGNNLVVRQPRKIHRAIERFIDALSRPGLGSGGPFGGGAGGGGIGGGFGGGFGGGLGGGLGGGTGF